jgi:hypothetical protein
MANLGSTDTPAAAQSLDLPNGYSPAIEEDSGDLVINDTNNNTTLRWDDTQGEWQLAATLDAGNNDVTNVGTIDTDVLGTDHAILSASYDGQGSTTSTSYTAVFNNTDEDVLFLGQLPSGWAWEVAYSVSMLNDTAGESCTSKPELGYWNGDPNTVLSYSRDVVDAAAVTVTTTSNLRRVWSGWVDHGFAGEPTMVNFRELKAKVSGGTGDVINPAYAFRAREA